jgi:hypothetical protein
MVSPLAAADAAFSTSAVARFLTLAEEFGVGHVRLIRMVGLHMLNVVVIVRNANQHFRRLTEVFFASPKLPNIVCPDKKKPGDVAQLMPQAIAD